MGDAKKIEQDRENEAKMIAHLGAHLRLLEGPSARGAGVEFALLSITIRTPTAWTDDTLIILRGEEHTGRPVVAFHAAIGTRNALLGALKKWRSGELRWKDDKYR